MGCGSVKEEVRPRPAEDNRWHDGVGVSMVVCAHAEARLEQTRAAVESVLGQRPRPAQVLLVVDHNTDLAARARRELAGVSVLENVGPPGRSGARNVGLRAAQVITAFLDDDAAARPGWLAGLSAGLERERSHVAVMIPAALFRDLRSCASGDLTAFMRVAATIGGLATAMAGYLTGRARFAGHRRTRSAVLPVEHPWSRAGW